MPPSIDTIVVSEYLSLNPIYSSTGINQKECLVLLGLGMLLGFCMLFCIDDMNTAKRRKIKISVAN